MTAAVYRQFQAAVQKQASLHLQMLTLEVIDLLMTQTVLSHGLIELAEVLIRLHALRAIAQANLKLQVCLPTHPSTTVELQCLLQVTLVLCYILGPHLALHPSCALYVRTI